MAKEERRLVDEELVRLDLDVIDFCVEAEFEAMGLCPHGHNTGECDYCPGGFPETDEEDDDEDVGFSYLN